MQAELRVVAGCVTALADLVRLPPGQGPHPSVLHGEWRRLVDESLTAARKQGVAKADVEALLFPIVALVDEIALRDDAWREQWLASGPLQLHYFQENVAGETFFAHLDEELAGARRTGVLYLHYACLMLGFRGKHSGDPAALDEVIRKLSFVVEGDAQYPRERPAPQRVVPRPKRGIRLAPVLVALFSVVFSLVFVARSRCAIDERIHDAMSATTQPPR
jgi:type VI secretion system protein ImpK